MSRRDKRQKAQAVVTSPANGCVVLARLHTHIPNLPGVLKVQAWHDAYSEAQDRIRYSGRLPAFLDKTVRAKNHEMMDISDLRPPFPIQWIETISPGGEEFGRLGYLVRWIGEGEDVNNRKPAMTEILVYALQSHQTRPVGRGAVRIETDKQGHGVEVRGILPSHPDRQHADLTSHATQVDFIYPCIKVLQVMNALNVGWHEIRDPREDDRRLPRAIRRGFIGHRYHILTLRTAADIRAGRKEIANPGSMPLNTARGHWARYGIDGRGLLFGKYTGRYWVPSHARGKVANGIIDKDYKLPPETGREVA